MHIQDEEIRQIGKVRKSASEVVVIDGDVIQICQCTDRVGDSSVQLIAEKMEVLETSHRCDTLRDGAHKTVGVKSKASQHLQVADVTWDCSREGVVVEVENLQFGEFENERRNGAVHIVLIELKVSQRL